MESMVPAGLRMILYDTDRPESTAETLILMLILMLMRMVHVSGTTLKVHLHRYTKFRLIILLSKATRLSCYVLM